MNTYIAMSCCKYNMCLWSLSLTLCVIRQIYAMKGKKYMQQSQKMLIASLVRKRRPLLPGLCAVSYHCKVQTWPRYYFSLLFNFMLLHSMIGLIFKLLCQMCNCEHILVLLFFKHKISMWSCWMMQLPFQPRACSGFNFILFVHLFLNCHSLSRLTDFTYRYLIEVDYSGNIYLWFHVLFKLFPFLWFSFLTLNNFLCSCFNHCNIFCRSKLML